MSNESGMTNEGRKRILFIAEAVTLAHVARAATLAQSLDPALYEVAMACDPRYDFLFDGHRLKRYGIESISNRHFANALDKGLPIYDLGTLSRYVVDDIRVIEEFDPDVVVGDFRISLSVSARVTGKPYLNVTNAGWSPYAKARFTVPDIALTRILGARIGQMVFSLARPFAFALHSLPLNRLRRKYGLRPLPRDLRHTYTDADYVLYADAPELVRVYNPPSTHAFLGPVLWSPQLPDPSWIDRLPNDRPIIYLTLGSSGQKAVLPVALDALADVPFTIVAATAGTISPGRVSRNTFVADYLEGHSWAKRASAVVCNGGSPTCYQALVEGVPVLGIPGNLDQYLNMSAVEEFGAGKLVRSGVASAADIRKAVMDLVETPRFALNAARLAQAIEPGQAAAVLSETISRALAGVAR